MEPCPRCLHIACICFKYQWSEFYLETPVPESHVPACICRAGGEVIARVPQKHAYIIDTILACLNQRSIA